MIYDSDETSKEKHSSKKTTLAEMQSRLPFLPLFVLTRIPRFRREYAYLERLHVLIGRYRRLVADPLWDPGQTGAADKDKLLAYFGRAPILQPYLKRTEGSIQEALAHAAIDADTFLVLQQKDWWGQNGKSIAARMLMPVLLILLTAVVGNNVGTLLQEKSFQRTKRFELLTKRLTEGEKLAVELFLRVRDSHYWIVTRERDDLLIRSDAQPLRNHQKDLRRLERFAVGVDAEGSILDALNVANNEINKYIKCVEDPPSDGTACHTGFSPKSFERARAAFSEALISHLDKTTEVSWEQ